jgi:tripartite-type tricarboxylate transporter receptor subunit TctC
MVNLYKAGKLRVLAAGDDRRLKNLPEVPTFREAGLEDFSVPGWIGVVAPAGTPTDVLARLNREISRAASAPYMQALYEKMNLQMAVGGIDQMTQTVARDTGKWKPLVTALGITLD